jgi:hypothetical protein
MSSALSEQGPRSSTALSEHQCREQLRAYNGGRIAWHAADRPQSCPSPTPGTMTGWSSTPRRTACCPNWSGRPMSRSRSTGSTSNTASAGA